jgi:photosystem II stability/assembly factor-like uncharacterized protein
MNQVLFRVILIMCTVLTGLSDLRETTVAAGDSSSWYWQNPLPRSFSMNEIACPSAIECVTVGQEGSIMLTTDAGQHWASGDSGTTADLSYVACSGSSVCYALGSTDDGNALDLLLRSTDGGTAWSDVSQQLQIGEGQGDRPSFVCPSSTTCLLMSTIAGTAVHVYRTTDGGRHWKAVPRGPTSPAGGPITCVTTRICYAGSGHAVFRTADAGASWSEEAALPGPYLESLACPRANTCVASSGGHIYLTRNGGSTWRDVNRRAADVRTLVCGSPRLCYGIGFNSVVRTLDGGKSWESHAAPLFESIDQVVCPTGTRCFAAAGFTALETSDGFAHVRQAPASSAFGGTYLYSLSCPLPTTCYGRSYAYVSDIES